MLSTYRLQRFLYPDLQHAAFPAKSRYFLYSDFLKFCKCRSDLFDRFLEECNVFTHTTEFIVFVFALHQIENRVDAVNS